MSVLSSAQFQKVVTEAAQAAAATQIQDLVHSEEPQDLRLKLHWSLTGRQPFWFEAP